MSFEKDMEEIIKGPNPTVKQVVNKLEKPPKKRGVDDPKLVAWVSRKLRELYHGKKTYLNKKFKPTGKRT